MTAYTSAHCALQDGTLSMELRTVNHRFLDISMYLPDELREREMHFREILRSRLRRGKVACRANLTQHPSLTGQLALNDTLLKTLLSLAEETGKLASDAQPFSIAELLHWPGVVVTHTTTTNRLDEVITASDTLLEEATAALNVQREREGEKLQRYLIERLNTMQEIIAKIQPRLPQCAAAYEEKLKKKCLDAFESLDEMRIGQEMLFFMQKIDIDEEIARLQGHLTDAHRVLNKGGSVGKRLDFLMQELNREANTLGSKSVDLYCSQAAIDLKILIEQMREQIQNIE